MGQVNPKALVDGVVLTNLAATYYTVPAGTKTVVKMINLNNDSAGAVGVTINFVPTGGAAAASNQMFKNSSPNGLVLAAGETKRIPMNDVMEAGGFISMVAGTTLVIGCRITGEEIVG